jgi:uncharacterized protein with NRDE domain
MCLIVFALDCHPRYRLILGANRDEYQDRPSEPAAFWSDAPHLLAGRDKQAGGTWMGVTTNGKLAAVTNYRDARQQATYPRSRGRLVTDYLLDAAMTPDDFDKTLNRDGDRYDGFNLLYGTNDELHYFTNRGGSSGPVKPGIHALSNHLLDTRWPKVVTARTRLEAIVQHENPDPEEIFAALADPLPFADGLLPDTGIGLERERLLSPLFISGTAYGTRCTTVLLIDLTGRVTFLERGFDRSQQAGPTKRFSFPIRPPLFP